MLKRFLGADAPGLSPAIISHLKQQWEQDFGSDETGRKELLALSDGYQRWRAGFLESRFQILILN